MVFYNIGNKSHQSLASVAMSDHPIGLGCVCLAQSWVYAPGSLIPSLVQLGNCSWDACMMSE